MIRSPHHRTQLLRILAFGSFFIALFLPMHTISKITNILEDWVNGSQSVVPKTGLSIRISVGKVRKSIKLCSNILPGDSDTCLSLRNIHIGHLPLSLSSISKWSTEILQSLVPWIFWFPDLPQVTQTPLKDPDENMPLLTHVSLRCRKMEC